MAEGDPHPQDGAATTTRPAHYGAARSAAMSGEVGSHAQLRSRGVTGGGGRRPPRLVVLNGPPAAGKSTIARAYTYAHPMALRIDVDEVRSWLGGWTAAAHDAGLRARALALVMARDHLLTDHDVVIAQLYGRPDALDELADVATETGATFHHIVLLVDLEPTLSHFVARGGARLDETMANPSGLDAIAELHTRILDVVRRRPDAVVVRPTWGDIDATYRAVRTALGADGDG